MKGSLVNRNGHYSVILEDKDPVTGIRKQKWIAVKGNYKEASQQMTEMVNSYNQGIFVKPQKTTLADFLNQWLKDCIQPNLSIRTFELYSYMSKNHIIPAIGNIPLCDLKPQHLQHLYADKLSSGLNGRTVQLMHVTLHKALKNGVKTGLLMRNISESVDAPKAQRREMQVMSETDIHLFLDYAKDTEYYALFYLLLFTGLRRGEALALRWQDIDLLLCQLSVTRSARQLYNVDPGKQVTFKETKTAGSRRTVSLSPSTCAILREHQEAQQKQRQLLELPPSAVEDLVFSRYDGSPLRPDSVSHAWLKLVRRCGLKGIRLHDARHTHSTLMLKNGINVKVLAERLGHANISTTLNIYAHVTPSMQQDAANKFDDILLR